MRQKGGSAGGLLIGAAVNLAPERFRAVHASVPFVDALTTILDPTLPLTVVEWEEWGNPLEDPEVYAYMKEYTPYENVRPAEYPAILATTSLNDTRVYFTEPAKWVAALRATVTNDPAERPVLLRTEMVAGHGGAAGATTPGASLPGSGRSSSTRSVQRDGYVHSLTDPAESHRSCHPRVYARHWLAKRPKGGARWSRRRW